MRVAVIGAGPAGLTAAFRLAQRGVDVEVLEAGPAVGGLARSISLWNQTVDLGPHRFFSKDPRVNAFWLEAVGSAYRMIDRRTRILHDGKLFDYPLRPVNALANLGVFEALRCLGSYARESLHRAEPAETFETWVVRRFGRRLFEIFFRSYSEKLWGIPCERLDAAFAAQRIKGFSLGEALRDALGLAGVRHPTLVDRFAYPVGGTGSVYRELARRIELAGGRVRLRTPVRRVEIDAGRARGVVLADGEALPFDQVISTMPLTLLAQGLPELPDDVARAAAELRFRNTLLVYLRIDAGELFPDQWLYVHSPELRVGRITNFRNWAPELCAGEEATVLTLEFWCSDGDEIWSEPDDRSIERAKRELAATGLAGTARAAAGHVVRIRRCYPVYELGYRRRVATIADHLAGIAGLTAIGRYGAFKYNNQDHSILMGLLAAENLVGEGRHDLWDVNADYDYHEEAYITATGLEPAAHHAGGAA
ncbi:MAG TPA: FAD-dependent oxidoreductase [Thermoanaerobaculia bacterium]|nr:FAD-dependent oxidoreductase [Thermoanaerobaculia bacterium]